VKLLRLKLRCQGIHVSFLLADQGGSTAAKPGGTALIPLLLVSDGPYFDFEVELVLFYGSSLLVV